MNVGRRFAGNMWAIVKSETLSKIGKVAYICFDSNSDVGSESWLWQEKYKSKMNVMRPRMNRLITDDAM